jgi:tripeptidyl-peptidase-1
VSSLFLYIPWRSLAHGVDIFYVSSSGTTGFNATKGYDPVTGLGTPNFAKLLPLWLLAK